MRILYKLLFLFVACASLGAQNSLSLKDAIEKALVANYDIQIVQNNERVTEVMNSWGNAGMYPYIGASLYNNNSYNLNETNDNLLTSFNGGASINWTLFNGFSVRIKKNRLDELEQLSKQNTAIVIEGTVQSVILAYYNVLLQKEKLKLYDEVMNLSEDRFERAEEKKTYGAAVTYEVLQAKNAYLADKSSFLLQEVNVKNALRDLKYIMGVNSDEKYELSQSLEALPQEYVLSELAQKMAENNKSIQNQYLNQRLLENAIAAAKSTYMPALDFSGGATATRQRMDAEQSGVDWSNSARFYGNLTLSMNIYSGGSRNRALQIAKIDEETGEIEIEDMEHDLNNRLANLFELYEVRKELLVVAEENLEAAELNLTISKEKFDAGAINSFNYRDVQIIYLNASQQKLNAVYNFIDTHTALLRMTGTILQAYD